MSPALAGRFFTTESPGMSHYTVQDLPSNFLTHYVSNLCTWHHYPPVGELRKVSTVITPFSLTSIISTTSKL